MHFLQKAFPNPLLLHILSLGHTSTTPLYLVSPSKTALLTQLLLLSYIVLCWAQSLSHVQLFVTSWTAAHQAPLSVGFSRQEYQSGLPCPPPGDPPNPRIEPRSPALQADSLPAELLLISKYLIFYLKDQQNLVCCLFFLWLKSYCVF